ncbi:MAG: hypothetical protein KAW17_07405 [Candidatus Eisenbacteria sp.]|nr:hypothetical protein [Candidatus Eisenbacteria bacterium]
MTSTKLLTAIVIGAALVCTGTAQGEILTPEQVQELAWPGAMAMTLRAATDGVFEGGPHYHLADADEWLSESDVIDDRWDFTVSIRNAGIYPLDDVLLLLAHRGGTFSALTVGDWTASPQSFYPIDGLPFGAGGNRPGDGEAGVYANAQGVLFMRLRHAIPAGDTLEVPVRIQQGRADFALHIDVYGLRRNKVLCTCPASKDVSCIPTINPAAIAEQTWSKVKALFAF